MIAQTLGGNATVSLGRHVCNALRVATAGTTLTLGPNVLVHGHSGQLGYAPSCLGGQSAVSVVPAVATRRALQTWRPRLTVALPPRVWVPVKLR